jgi:hypothetical protein
MKILKRLSTAFYLETDGSIERMNQKLEAYLCYFVLYYQDNWKQLLVIATLAINSRISFVIKFSSFFATHNYDIKPIKMEESLKTKSIIPTARKKAFISKLKDITEMAQVIMAVI